MSKVKTYSHKTIKIEAIKTTALLKQSIKIIFSLSKNYQETIKVKKHKQ